MAEKYPFTNAEELKKNVSGVDINFEPENIESGNRRAAAYVKDLVSEEVWQLMIDHFNDTDNYNQPNQENENYLRLDNLVENMQFPLSNFTFFFHFIWLQVRIANDTVKLSDKQNTPYKYQEDEAKDQLLEAAHEGISDLIDFLNKEATQWSDWLPETEYATADVVKYGGNYYTANSDFTSGTEFTPANWTSKPAGEVIFKEWTNSLQYMQLKNEVFANYKEFDQYFGINRSAAFYVKARTIIHEVVVDHVYPRTGTLPNEKVTADATLLSKIKRYVAYSAMSIATLRMDYYLLPGSIRKNIDSEYTRKSLTEAKNVRESLSVALGNKADEYLNDIDLYLAQKDKTPDDKPYDKFKSTVTSDDKFSSMGI